MLSFEFGLHTDFQMAHNISFHFAATLEDLYAFNYTALDIVQKHVGWDFFDLQSEFLRMGVPNDNWVQSLINKDYEVGFIFNVLSVTIQRFL